MYLERVTEKLQKTHFHLFNVDLAVEAKYKTSILC